MKKKNIRINIAPNLVFLTKAGAWIWIPGLTWWLASLLNNQINLKDQICIEEILWNSMLKLVLQPQKILYISTKLNKRVRKSKIYKFFCRMSKCKILRGHLHRIGDRPIISKIKFWNRRVKIWRFSVWNSRIAWKWWEAGGNRSPDRPGRGSGNSDN